MSRLPSEIEALLRDVQSSDEVQNYHNSSLPYTQPGVPYHRSNAMQHQSIREQQFSHAPMSRKPLYESQNLQASGFLEAPNPIHQKGPSVNYGEAVTSLAQPQMSLGQYLNPPKNNRVEHSSSPPTCLPSSPSFALTQRRDLHGAYMTEQHPPRTRPQPAFPSFDQPQTQVQTKRVALNHAPPVVQGIQLVSPNDLADRFRSVFPFQLFNAVQSKCYQSVFASNDNLVVLAPTGSGKTVILEMAICKLLLGLKSDQYKIVYMAPTKSLCSERQRDWQAKFSSFDLQCAELTGDTDHAQLRHVQNASIIITTPEKWDSMTRKWKDHVRLMQLVKLFLIDEVHILKETRGATLEAVVSRMKSVQTSVRFVALSATVPNSQDIAQWLGKDHNSEHSPARQERFGEKFRPVKLQKYVYGLPYRGSDFGFETACDPKLPDIISKHSHKKPMMLFCMTRKSCISTARLLANFWAVKNPRDREWPGPTFRVVVQDPELKAVLASGVAFHHAGLDLPDRHAVEKGFLEGQIHVICCTSTLAVGVNLPCHLVIIKNTVCFQDDGIKEYADLEIMQMLGRAGRPQYDDSAVAVIITKQEKAKKYEKMMSGEEVLESCLHLNLIDHLNAEVGLGTVYDLHSAKKWLAGTFLAVRLGHNPDHYKLDGDSTNLNLDERIERICQRDLRLLQDNDLLCTKGTEAKLKCTDFGDAMARYCIKFETMRILLSLGAKPKISEILSAVSQAEEYRDIRLKAGEKALYKEINKANGIKFPIKVDLALHAHKRSLLIQAELGGVEFPADEQYSKHRRQCSQDKAMVFSHVNRLIRCIVDCQLHRQDAIGARHALELARSFSAKVWDNSPLQMKQLPQIGLAAIRKLVMGGVNSIEALEIAEPHRIETLMSRHPPFGQKLLGGLKDFPKLRVSMKLMGKEVRQKESVRINIKVECGFLNDRPPTMFHRRLIYVCLLVERSDGLLIDFRRISAKKLVNGQDILLSALLTQHEQSVTSYVMCDEIAGTMRFADLKHGLSASAFPESQPEHHKPENTVESLHGEKERTTANQRLKGGHPFQLTLADSRDDEFADSDFDEESFMALADANEAVDRENANTRPVSTKSKARPIEVLQGAGNKDVWNPTRLENGKWACNHKCKDKSACRHLCCREGVDKAPKRPKSSIAAAESSIDLPKKAKASVTQAVATTQPNSLKSRVDHGPLSQGIHTVEPNRGRDPEEYGKDSPRDYKKLHHFHERSSKTPSVRFMLKPKTSVPSLEGAQSQLSFLGQKQDHLVADNVSSEYEDDWMDDLPSTSDLLGQPTEERVPPDKPCQSNFDEPPDEGDSDLEAALIGLDDSTVVAENVEDIQTLAVPNNGDGGWESYTIRDEREKNPAYQHLPAEPARSSRPERLFLSTDSPEKTESSIVKRKVDVDNDIESERSSRPWLAKKRRTMAQTESPVESCADEEICEASPNSSQTLDLSTSKADPNPSAVEDRNGRPLLPEWTKDIDPEFLAYFVREYGHLVEWWPEDTQVP